MGGNSENARRLEERGGLLKWIFIIKRGVWLWVGLVEFNLLT